MSAMKRRHSPNWSAPTRPTPQIQSPVDAAKGSLPMGLPNSAMICA